MSPPSSSPKGDRANKKTPASRVDKLLGSMGYGSRTEMARLGKAGGIVLDGVDLTDVSKRIAVTPDLPARMVPSDRSGRRDCRALQARLGRRGCRGCRAWLAQSERRVRLVPPAQTVCRSRG